MDDLALHGFNPLFAVLHARSKDSPGKTWWHAEAMHDAIFRALQIDRNEEGAIYAAAPFRLHRDEDKGWRVLVAFPCPPLFSEDGDDWLGIETVLAWDPKTDAAEMMDDDTTKLVGSVPPDATTLHVHSSPFAFLRAYAEERARWFVTWSNVNGDWQRKPHEPDLTPGLLLLDEPDKVTWPQRQMPGEITCHGIDARAINRALLRQARIPRAVAAPQPMRDAA